MPAARRSWATITRGHLPVVAVETTDCPRCGAPADCPCTTSRGRPMAGCHAARLEDYAAAQAQLIQAAYERRTADRGAA